MTDMTILTGPNRAEPAVEPMRQSCALRNTRRTASPQIDREQLGVDLSHRRRIRSFAGVLQKRLEHSLANGAGLGVFRAAPSNQNVRPADRSQPARTVGIVIDWPDRLLR